MKNQGELLPLVNGGKAEIIEKIGEGGQGEVYKVYLRASKEVKALKLFNNKTLRAGGDELYWRISSNIEYERKHKTFAPVFLWPEDLIEPDKYGVWGYVMPLMEPRFKELNRFLSGKVSFHNYGALVDAALNIDESFRKLHENGFVYMDINSSNIAIDPRNGDIAILDTDNITGNDHTCVCSPIYFQAPEIVRGDISVSDKYTDLYSMAVLFFYMFFMGHPLEGSRLPIPLIFTDDVKNEYYGDNPIFIWDACKENLPSKRFHLGPVFRRKGFPDFVRLAFARCFSRESLTDINARENLRLENSWPHILMRLKSSLTLCPHCGGEMFADFESAHTLCLSCRGKLPDSGLYLEFTRRRSGERVAAPVYPGVRLYNYHMRYYSADYKSEAALIREKESEGRRRFFLSNISPYVWTAEKNGRKGAVNKDEAVELENGLIIDFGEENIAIVKKSQEEGNRVS